MLLFKCSSLLLYSELSLELDKLLQSQKIPKGEFVLYGFIKLLIHYYSAKQLINTQCIYEFKYEYNSL